MCPCPPVAISSNLRYEWCAVLSCLLRISETGRVTPVTHRLGPEQYHHRACSAETWGGGRLFVSLMY